MNREDPRSIDNSTNSISPKQFATFYLGGRLYGIDVMRVQEVTNSLPMTHVPLSPQFVRGLINLRGQISTAINLRAFFGIQSDDVSSEKMNVVCRVGDLLLSFLVDSIGDVVEPDSEQYEEAPETIADSIRRYMVGVYKVPGQILSIIDVNKVAESILASSRPKNINSNH